MFKLFKKKEEETDHSELPEQGSEDETNENISDEPKKIEEKKIEIGKDSNQDILRMSTEIDKLKAGQEAFQEVRKSFTERFTRTSEQIGELRSMILERDRTIQEIELKSVKAADLVQSVKPEKLMIEIQKQEAKSEALKANIEGNESIMDRIMEELREVRKKVEFFRGVEEIIKLSEEVKKELIEIKKIEGQIKIQTDKVGTIYSEMRTKIQTLDEFNSEIQETKANMEQNTKDLDFMKNKISSLAEKDEIDKLMNKVQSYMDSIKQVEKSSPLSKDIDKLKILLEEIK